MIGSIMAKGAYIGTAIGFIGGHLYMKKYGGVLVGGLITLGGLALGSYISGKYVEKKGL